MELKHLRTFLRAAEQSSFTRAAESLGVTQAAVSQHVAALERELQGELFERQGRTIALTEPGRRLQDYARRILELADEAVRKVGGGGPPVEGTLRIAASSVPAESLVPDLLARFHAEFPGVRESLMVSDSQGAAAAIEAGQADIGFTGELPRSKQLAARAIATDELVLVVPADHPWAGRRSVTLEQLLGEPLILREPESGSRHCLERALEEHGVRLAELNAALQVNSNEAIRSAVQGGIGVAFLSTRSLGADLQSGKLQTIKVRGLKLTRQLYLITRRGQTPSPVVREFLRFVS